MVSGYNSEDVIAVDFQNYHKNLCGYPIIYNGEEITIYLQYTLKVTFFDGSEYFIGYEFYDDVFMTLQIK